ncbi:sugar ABC transporter permease [Paenibacillus glucanolyticus]|uniref:ABC transporter permease subunit n=1 Tax=Paenibacillus TaxID=44249 RepID=UPI0003E257E5|nr:sugar ABC transporter permease [Paenibacillus glucanolyticus]ETT42477.1 binding-protein-dependent transport systems inner membrane component [Paenibacillus sp. FSL R5-808]MCA4752352.1 sugar ABC transporter permease [Mycolicibacterium fortuitum]
MRAVFKYKTLYFMMFPILAYFLIFSFYPLARGLVISFQDYRLIGDRPFIGFDNYGSVLKDPAFWDVSRNTLVIGGGIFVINFILPLILALSLNEVTSVWFKKMTQMIVYLPHLFSWVVVGGMWILLLSPDTGIVNQIIQLFGGQSVGFLSSDRYARTVMILTSGWKEMGYTCILYLAAIVNINPSLYEAASMDGASRWQKVRYVTLPMLKSTMKVVIMLNILGILRMFDQIFVMSNGAIANKVDVIMMYTYQKGILEFSIGPATAAGFLVIMATFMLTYATRAVIRYDEG